MQNFLELATERHSIRSFTSEPVSDDDIDYIFRCVQIAPSAVNFQPWHFYVAKSKLARKKLDECYPREWFSTAPVVIVACIDHEAAWHRNDGKDHGDIDIAIATEHLVLAAEERGLGSCWVCNFDAKLCHTLLDLPDRYEAAVLIPLGHTDPNYQTRPRTRKPLSDIVTPI